MSTDLAIWLYGSHARGDNDELSDLDLLVVSAGSVAVDHITIRTLHAAASHYSWSEIEGMAGDGSLFLQHLRREGVPLYESAQCLGRLQAVMRKMPPYKNARRDVWSFRMTLQDVRASLASAGSVPFEAAVVGKIIRHASILGCYLAGQPTFSRWAPVQLATEVFKVPFSLKRFHLLYEYVHLADGSRPKCSAHEITGDEVLYWCDVASKLITRIANGHDK